MAYATNDTSAFRNAILRVWTPAIGARSFDDLLTRNVDKVIASSGLNPLAPLMILDNIPFAISDTIGIYSDDQPPFEIGEEIISGSWSEGLFFYGYSNTSIPDLDYMLVLKNISFSEEGQQSGCLTLKEDTPFIYAYITNENAKEMWKDFLVDQEDMPNKRLSSKKLKERLEENEEKFLLITSDDGNSNSVGEGAALYTCRDHFVLTYFNRLLNIIPFSESSKIGDAMGKYKDLTNDCCKLFTGCDIVLAISCEGWPSCAREWITRDRIWPQDNLVQKITHDGFHIVPKSSTEGDFRLSFSYAETTLIENLTELQHKVLRSFKAVVKYHQNTWSPNIKEIITTYHLKTIAFWCFEKRIQDSCTEETVATHLVLLLQELAEALRNRELPMYFMPKVNLFRNVENPEEAIDIAEKIEQLSHDFPLVIEGLENITSGLARYCGLAQNIIKKCVLDHGWMLRENRSDQAHPPPNDHETMQKVSKIFDGVRNICKFLNPVKTDGKLSGQNTGKETEDRHNGNS